MLAQSVYGTGVAILCRYTSGGGEELPYYDMSTAGRYCSLANSCIIIDPECLSKQKTDAQSNFFTYDIEEHIVSRRARWIEPLCFRCLRRDILHTPIVYSIMPALFVGSVCKDSSLLGCIVLYSILYDKQNGPEPYKS